MVDFLFLLKFRTWRGVTAILHLQFEICNLKFKAGMSIYVGRSMYLGVTSNRNFQSEFYFEFQISNYCLAS